MILPIYTYGQPVLRKEAQDITADYPDLKQLIADMFETLTQADGVGLAAPQIGKDIRLVVIDLDVLKEDMPEYNGFKKFISIHTLLNTTILKQTHRKKDASHCQLYTRK